MFLNYPNFFFLKYKPVLTTTLWLLNHCNKYIHNLKKSQLTVKIDYYSEKLDIIFNIDSYIVILSSLDICDSSLL